MAHENLCPWDSAEQAKLIGIIAILGSLWTPEMTEEETMCAYELAMNPPEQNPAKIGEV